MGDFRYVGGGWFRDASVPVGETAEMLHGDHALATARARVEVLEAMLRRCVEAMTPPPDTFSLDAMDVSKLFSVRDDARALLDDTQPTREET